MQFQSLCWEDSLEGEMASHSSSCLENPLDRGAWRVTVNGIGNRTEQLSTHTLKDIQDMDKQGLSGHAHHCSLVCVCVCVYWVEISRDESSYSGRFTMGSRGKYSLWKRWDKAMVGTKARKKLLLALQISRSESLGLDCAIEF